MGEYDDVLGTLGIGVALNTYLYGVLSCQYARYHNKKFEDNWRVKVVVFFLLAVDTVQSVFMIYLYWSFILPCLNGLSIFTAPTWPSASVPIGTAITASTTHAFLGARMLVMLNNKIMFGAVLTMSLAELGAGVALGIRMWVMKDTHTELHALKPFLITWLTLQMSIDIFISGVMSVFLYLHRTGFPRTDRVLNRIIRGCIQTGVFSAMLAISGVVAYVLRPYAILYTMFMIPIGRTYTTSLMDTLNVRKELKKQLVKEIGSSGQHGQAGSMFGFGRQLSPLGAEDETGEPGSANLDVGLTHLTISCQPRSEDLDLSKGCARG